MKKHIIKLIVLYNLVIFGLFLFLNFFFPKYFNLKLVSIFQNIEDYMKGPLFRVSFIKSYTVKNYSYHMKSFEKKKDNSNKCEPTHIPTSGMKRS